MICSGREVGDQHTDPQNLRPGEAREFYVNFLGFKVDWEHRFEAGLPLYLQVSREGCTLHLTEHHGDCCPGAALRIETMELEA